MHATLVSGLRVELRRLVDGAGNRRSLTPTCFVGRPGGVQVRLEEVGAAGPSLRADLVERALDGLVALDGASAWVTRSGDLDLTDPDVAWFVAAGTGFGRHGLRLAAFPVLNRTGWVDLVSGEHHEWGRIRRRPRRSGPRAS